MFLKPFLDVWTRENSKPSKNSSSFHVCILRHICFEGKWYSVSLGQISQLGRSCKLGSRPRCQLPLLPPPPPLGYVISIFQFSLQFKFKKDRLQIIEVAKKYIYVSQLFISRMPKMLTIPQLVSAPLISYTNCRIF